MEFSRCTRENAPAGPERRLAARRAAACRSLKTQQFGPLPAYRRRNGGVDVVPGEPGHRTARVPSTRRAPAAVGAAAFPRKEVIQPHLPVRLPCYDFVPIASPTFDDSLPQGVGPPASGVTDFRDVTGGVYKARERIHRSNADLRLLATPPSWRRVSASNPNRDRLFGIRSLSRVCSPLYRPM